ncbi:helix-turn-helix domain-containing protein [Rhizobium leguminosarum]|uniref:helix-turn-helix domain-containing protein n=1 Tax=Rhizobium leguminosarum TaxID=384 RepID=UPI001C96C5A2|nr:helix-turn-helix domain-containing protein [Rhizobium leguminosarum]MBY5614213.1 hypothetical protein [Rhizobium leguminosarum]
MTGKTRGYAFDVDAWVQFHLLRAAAFHPKTTKADVAVLAEIIQRYHGKFGNGWASHEHLGSMAGIHKASVIRAKRNLERLGFITVVQPGRRGSATVYQPNFALIPEKGSKDATETKGSILATETVHLGSIHETESAEYGSTDATPSYLPDRPTKAESQIDRNDPAPPSAPLPVGRAATGADGAGGGFEEVWKAYDYKQKKAEALAAYKKLAPDEELHERIVGAASIWKASWAAQQKTDAPRFTLAKWLEREEFECGPPTAYKAKEKKAPAPKKQKPQAANDNEDEDWESGPMICDVGPFTPFGRFKARIVGSQVEHIDSYTEKVVLDLDWTGRDLGADAQHTFYFQHQDPKVQERGQAFVQRLAECTGIDELTDTEQLHGAHVYCTINNRLAISYEAA